MLLLLLLLSSLCEWAIAAGTPPNGYACQNATHPAFHLPFCDAALSFDQRVDDLLRRLTFDEVVGLLHAQPGTDACAFIDHGVARLDIPPYAWTEEANTGADSACLGPNKCATTFSSPALLAASFNNSVWRTKGEVISTEVRALNNAHGHRGCGPPAKIGVNEWGPNINLVRDPRFGRNSELPSEDPYLSGRYAVQYVRGLQAGPDPKYTKVLATLKHFTAYSVENNRGHDSADISAYDLADSYLRQFEMGFVEGRAAGVMCSYNLIDGTPNCANPALLNGKIRGEWGRPDAVVVSDCGALGNMRGVPTNWTAVGTVARSFGAGLDLDTGNKGKSGFVFVDAVADAVSDGVLAKATLDAALRRSLLQRFQAGAFDPLEHQQYTAIGVDQFNSSAHWAFNLEAATQGPVLLRNEGAALPLGGAVSDGGDGGGGGHGGKKKKKSTIAVVGPHAVSRHGLFSDYYGDQVCFDAQSWSSRNYSCVQSIGEALTVYNEKSNGEGGTTLIEPGVTISAGPVDNSSIASALAAVAQSDVVVLVLGTDTISVEHEGQDRDRLTLPGIQQDFALQVLDAAGQHKVPVVLLLINGGAVAFDALLRHPAAPAAIVEGFFPGQRGAEALARLLFGAENRWGRLPFSIMTEAFGRDVDMADMSMARRTYRYADPSYVLFPFGAGLSLTSFDVSFAGGAIRSSSSSSSSTTSSTSLVLKNVGSRAGDVVLMAYFRPVSACSDDAMPCSRLRSQLFDFQRFTLDSGASATAVVAHSAEDLALVDSQGIRAPLPGVYELRFSIGAVDGASDLRANVTVAL